MSETTTTQIIPFGKYKGQPADVLLSDKQYLDWLLQQPWFKEKNVTLYTQIVNNFTEPTCTPDHNAMQIKFLNKNYVYGLINIFKKNRLEYLFNNFEKCYFVRDNSCYDYIQVFDYNDWFYKIKGLDNKNYWLNYDWSTSIKNSIQESYCQNFNTNSILYETDGWDVIIKNTYYIELKPIIGDDYPSILRKLKTATFKRNERQSHLYIIVIVRDFNATNITYEQCQNFFKSQNVYLINENLIKEFNPASHFVDEQEKIETFSVNMKTNIIEKLEKFSK